MSIISILATEEMNGLQDMALAMQVMAIIDHLILIRTVTILPITQRILIIMQQDMHPTIHQHHITMLPMIHIRIQIIG